MLTNACAVSAEEIAAYDREGYLLKPGLFSEQECDRLLRIFESHADIDFAAILNLDRKVPQVLAFLRDPRCVSIVETLKGAEMVLLQSQVLFKRVGTPYAAQAWNPHQDNGYSQAPAGQSLTILLALADADAENGCLYVFPGSHKLGLLPFEPMPSFRETPGTNPGNTVRIPESFARVDVPLKQGSLLIFDGEMAHGSHANRSSRSRPSISAFYVVKGAPFLPGQNAKRKAIPLR